MKRKVKMSHKDYIYFNDDSVLGRYVNKGRDLLPIMTTTLDTTTMYLCFNENSVLDML